MGFEQNNRLHSPKGSFNLFHTPAMPRLLQETAGHIEGLLIIIVLGKGDGIGGITLQFP